MKVVAGPSEATAIGNILLQAKADEQVVDKLHIRQIVNNSSKLEEFSPLDSNVWDNHYQTYKNVFIEK
jgi:rhamnulokinase